MCAPALMREAPQSYAIISGKNTPTCSVRFCDDYENTYYDGLFNIY